MRKPRALIVDDVVDMAETIANELAAASFDVEVVDSGTAALERFAQEPADVVITDLRMKNVDGLDVLTGIKRADPTVPVIIMTAFGGIDSAVEAMRRGARDDFFPRPGLTRDQDGRCRVGDLFDQRA